jgi:DNA-directed RNA polymerase subunit RPC12/RpoP
VGYISDAASFIWYFLTWSSTPTKWKKHFLQYLHSLSFLKSIFSLYLGIFTSPIYLIEHEKRSHLENASVKCFRCGKLYKNVQSLKNHIRAVHSVIGQPYSCNQCTAKFKWSTTLKQHIEEIPCSIKWYMLLNVLLQILHVSIRRLFNSSKWVSTSASFIWYFLTWSSTPTKWKKHFLQY